MIRMELPNDMRCVADTAAFVADLSQRYGVAKEKAPFVRFMTEAALELRIKGLADQKATVTMEMEERASDFVVRITDKGYPYVLTPYQREVFRRSNLGRLLFEQLGSDGQRLTFLIRQDHGYVMSEPPAPREETLADREVICRRTQPDPEDIIEAITCLYEVYRYEYIHQELYHTDEFERLLESGKYVSVLAENAHHQVLGHAALEEREWFPGIREICNLVVKPMARRLGLSNLLCDELVDIAVREDAGNLYGMPVLYHPITQKLFNKAKLLPCGLYANFSDISVVKGYEDNKGRLSVAMCFRRVGQANCRTLYLPEECAGFVQEMYDELGLPMRRAAGGDAVHDVSAVSRCISTSDHKLEIKIDAIGPDLRDRLESWWQQGDLDGYKVVMVYLNVCDPQAPTFYEYFREHGFVFTGCLPGSSQGDYLLLQNLFGNTFDRDNVALLPNYEELVERLYQINRF